MELEGSLPHSPESATCLCPEPEQSNSHLISLKCILILSSHLLPVSQAVPHFQVLPHPHVYLKYLMYCSNLLYVPLLSSVGFDSLTLRCIVRLRSELRKNNIYIALCLNILSLIVHNTLRTGLLNCLNARSRGLTFRHRASCI